MVQGAVGLALLIDPGVARAAESPPPADQELDEVVVTGSRIVRRDYEAQTPIVTVQSETFEDRSSVGIEAALQQLPQFAPSAGAQSNSGSSTRFLHRPPRRERQQSTCAAWAPTATWCWWMGGACSP